MSTAWYFVSTVALLVCWQCLLRQAAASLVSASCAAEPHPQRKFCDADYVFRCRTMTWPESDVSSVNRVGRRKRRVNPMRQMAKVEHFYKGKELAMGMMKLTHANDTFTDDDEIEASIRLGPSESLMKMNGVYVYFGKLMRKNDKILPMDQQMMMSQCKNAMASTEITKVINRGLRKKYEKGCQSGCKVQIVYREMPRSKSFCYWNKEEYSNQKVDCCKTSQFCHMGKSGFCEWKATKAFRTCKSKNTNRSKYEERMWP